MCKRLKKKKKKKKKKNFKKELKKRKEKKKVLIKKKKKCYSYHSFVFQFNQLFQSIGTHISIQKTTQSFKINHCRYA